MADMARVGGENWQEREMFPGVPVEQAFYRDGKPYMRSTMESLERGPIDAQVFEAPADYRVQKGMPGH
jgi:hypothetical protein